MHAYSYINKMFKRSNNSELLIYRVIWKPRSSTVSGYSPSLQKDSQDDTILKSMPQVIYSVWFIQDLGQEINAEGNYQINDIPWN